MRPMHLLMLLALMWQGASSRAATAPVLTHRYTYHLALSSDTGVGIAMGSDGDIFVTGRIGNGCGGTGDIYVARLDALLNKKWEIVLDVGGCKDNYPTGIAVYGDTAYVSGYGAGALTDGFVVKVDSGGNQGWTRVDALGSVGYLDIVVQPTDGSIWVIGTYPGFWSNTNFVAKKLLDGGATVSVGQSIEGGGRYNEIGVGLGVASEGVLAAGSDDGYAGRVVHAALWGLPSAGSGYVTSLWLESGGLFSFAKSVGRANPTETYVLFSQTYSGGRVSLSKVETNATVIVHNSGSGSFRDKGRIAVHPTLPLVVVADGPVLNGYDNSLNPLWQASLAGLTSPTFHGVIVSPYLPLTVYAVAESSGVGGTEIDVVRLVGSDPLKKAGELVIAPNKVNRAGPRPYALLLLRGTPRGTVSLRIFDVAGHLIKTFETTLDGGGRGQFQWDVSDRSGASALQQGTYWVVAQGGGVTDRKPVAVIVE